MMGLKRLLFIVLLLTLGIFCQQGHASNTPSPAKPAHTILKKPQMVLFGIFPVSLYDFNFSNRTFKVSFYAWWRSANKDYKPETSIEITNATEYYSKFGAHGQNKDEYFTYVHYYATLNHDWNIKHFPFDRQLLDIRLEDFADIQSVIFDIDDLNSRVHSELSLEGWDIMGFYLRKSTTLYATNFGDISTDKGKYSRLTFIFDIKRKGWRTYFSYYIGFFVSFILCCLLYFIDAGNIGARASLSLGAIFTAIGNKYIIDQALPFTSEFTLSDAIQLATFTLVLFTILTFIVIHTYYVYHEHHKKTLRKLEIINRSLAVFWASLYVIFVSYFTYLATNS